MKSVASSLCSDPLSSSRNRHRQHFRDHPDFQHNGWVWDNFDTASISCSAESTTSPAELTKRFGQTMKHAGFLFVHNLISGTFLAYIFLLRCLLFNCIWIWFAKHFCNFLYLPCVICNHHDTFFRSCSLGNHLHWCHCFSGGLTCLTSFFLHHHSCQISDLCRIYIIVDTSIFTTFFNSDLVKSHQTVLTTWTNHTIMGVSYQSNCNFSRNSLSVIKSTDEWERRVILEKLSVGSPSLEVTRHLVAQHTKINNDLKDTILMFYFLRPFQKTPQPFLSDIFLCL